MIKLDKDDLEKKFILSSMCNGGFIETDGENYWLVEENTYKTISKIIARNLVKSKVVYSKKIDDETSWYYLTEQSKWVILKMLNENDSTEEQEEFERNRVESDVKTFLNL